MENPTWKRKPKQVDNSDKDIHYLPINNENWGVNAPDPSKLFVGCKAINDTEAVKVKLKKIFDIQDADKIDVFESYAIIHFETASLSSSGQQLAIREYGLKFEGEDILLGHSFHHLGCGRHELIRDYKITNAVLECEAINEYNRIQLNNIAEKHGIVIQMKVGERLAYIKYSDYTSVISLLAVENDTMFRAHKMVAKLDVQILIKLAVKAKYMTLVRRYSTVFVCQLGDLKYHDDEFVLKEVSKVFTEFGTVRRVKRVSPISAYVDFTNEHSAYRALCKRDIKRTKHVTWLVLNTNKCMMSIIVKPVEDIGNSDNSAVSEYQGTTNQTFYRERVRAPETVFADNDTTGFSSKETDYTSLLNSIIPFSTNTQQHNKIEFNGAANVQNLPNDIEIICTMPNCLDYSKKICRTFQNLDLKVGVINPPKNYAIDSIVESMKTSGVKAIVFVDLTNAKTETLSAKFMNNSFIKMKDIPLSMAVHEFANAFGRNIVDELEQQPLSITNHQEDLLLNNIVKPQTTAESNIIKFLNAQKMKKLCGRVAKEENISLRENDKLIKYLTELRNEKVSEEYGDYIPQSLKNVPVGPFGDRELKAERKNIEESVDELIGRFFTENDLEKSTNDTDVNKDKIASAISTLLSLKSFMNSSK